MKPQLPTIVPGVVDGLLALFTTETLEDGSRRLVVAEAPVQVVDGPPLSLDTLAYDCLIVAHGTPTEPGVFSTMVKDVSLGRVSYQESAEVALVFSTFAGDVSMQTRRDRASEVLAAVKGLVDDNQVTDTWDALRMGGEMVWYPVQSGGGATLAVGFTIVAEGIV